ncbi:MAG: NAD-dependent epimerase/dehydratase family protein [Acidimicrobiia bacterium]|nr:NAD-dependent epimerase/dehydratase family protein [Acidimicrobiia bacterium]
MSPPRAFLTGGAGFLGRALARHFRDAGWETCGVDLVADVALDVEQGDISAGEAAWREGLTGCDTLVHTAALVSNTASLEAAWTVNVQGTRNVLDAAAAAGVRRSVLLSSCAVYSNKRDGVVDEARPVRPSGDAYGDTKIAAEQVALQMHAEGAVDVTILRPASVFGPASRPWTVIPVEMLKAGLVVLPAMGNGVFTTIYVDDLADLVRVAAEADDASGQVFNAAGGSGVTTREFFGHYSRMLGIGPPRVAPTGVAVALATVVGRTLRTLGRPSEVTAASMRMLAATGDISTAKAERVLGWTAKVGLEEGMQRTEVWLHENGYLP